MARRVCAAYRRTDRDGGQLGRCACYLQRREQDLRCRQRGYVRELLDSESRLESHYDSADAAFGGTMMELLLHSRPSVDAIGWTSVLNDRSAESQGHASSSSA